MSICCILYEDLYTWVKTKAKPGDVAYWHDRITDKHYYYFYKGSDPHPAWFSFQEDTLARYIDEKIEEINKPKIKDATVNKRCENCKYFKSISGADIAGSWCEHDEHKGIFVPKFVSCPEYEPKEKKSTPFDGVKLYLVDDKTGELAIKYVCEDCGKIMDKPSHWWLSLPLHGINGKQMRATGYHFRCEECDKKKDGKV